MDSVFRFCPANWPYRMATGIQPGAFVKITRVEYFGDTKIAYVYSLRGRHQIIHRVLLDDLKTPESVTPLNNSGCMACKAKCPIDKRLRRKLHTYNLPEEVVDSRVTPAIRCYLKAIGRLGGLKVSRGKLCQLEAARKRLAELRKTRFNKASIIVPDLAK